MSELKKQCIDVAAKALSAKGWDHLDPVNQVENIFAYAATDRDFAQVITTKNNKVTAELKAQIKYICTLGLDTAKGRKLVYVKTRGYNQGTKQSPDWLTMPDISESYHALIYVLVRNKTLNNISVQHTYENYPVEYSGNINDVPIVKTWEKSPEERGEYTGCFVTLYLPDDTVMSSYYHLSDILSHHKEYSKSSSTWNKHLQAMVAKSAIMEALRYIPVFNDEVAAMVEHYDQSMDWDKQETISDDQFDHLSDLIDESEVDEKTILKAGKCSSLADMSMEKYHIVVARLEAKIKDSQSKQGDNQK